MKQAMLAEKQFDELQLKGYTFTARSYYWKFDEGNIANRITKDEFRSRSIAEPFQDVEQVRVYRKINPVDGDE